LVCFLKTVTQQDIIFLLIFCFLFLAALNEKKTWRR
jgi:hypothetical protein